ncbi:plant lectins antimicrobial peptide, partial [Colletotrichum incanum]
ASPDGSCGGTNQFTCAGSSLGSCCSSGNWCGDTTSHCGAGCQSKFGNCTAIADNVSTDGRCGSNGKTCLGSAFGSCCSEGGWCGTEQAHCSAGCQTGFGNCTTSGSTTTPVSTDGSCGKNGKTCKGSAFGACCSSAGFCGGTSDHCGTGCQSSFGTCNGGSGAVSTDGACGKNGRICKGSAYGDCCSASNYCGKTTDHCGAGCQSAFGTCSSGSGAISTDGSCSTNGKTCKGSPFGDCCSASNYCGKTTAHCGSGW